MSKRNFDSRDGNEPAIVAELEKAGASVTRIRGACGVPDLLVGFHGHTFLVEVKNPATNPKAQCVGVTRSSDPADDCYGLHPQLSHKQAKWILAWVGAPVHVVESPAQALTAIDACITCLALAPKASRFPKEPRCRACQQKQMRRCPECDSIYRQQVRKGIGCPLCAAQQAHVA